MAQQNSFLLIFAVIPRYESIWKVRFIITQYDPVYPTGSTYHDPGGTTLLAGMQAMSRLVPGSSVEILEEDSENIVELITESYSEITSTIEVKVDSVPEDVRVTIMSR